MATDSENESGDVVELSSDEEALGFSFALPPEVLDMVLSELYAHFCQTLTPAHAGRLMLPLTEVSRIWYDLARPRSLRHVQVSPNRAHKLVQALNCTRRWYRYVWSLHIDFGVHYSQHYTHPILNLIASCCNLVSLNLEGCGKPVYKSFVAGANSVVFAHDLRQVFGRLQYLEVSGSRKLASTGLDAAKVLHFLLPQCSSLVTLTRGHFSYESIPVAPLQPIQMNGALYSASIPTLQSLTLSSQHIGSRVVQQAKGFCQGGSLKELIIISNEMPQRRSVEELLRACKNTLEILKIHIPFNASRAMPLIDSIVPTLTRLRKLALLGQLCTDDLLDELVAGCPHLKHLTLANNKTVTCQALMHYVSLAGVAAQHQATVTLDDMSHASWDRINLRLLSRQCKDSGWSLECSSLNWHGDNEAVANQAPAPALLGDDAHWPWPGVLSPWLSADYIPGPSSDSGSEDDSRSDDWEAEE